jgi:glucose-1-phosphate cytidylyltransferase
LDENSILETETVKKLISDGEITAYKYDGFWECMDTYKDTRVLNKIYACGNAKWMVWEK